MRRIWPAGGCLTMGERNISCTDREVKELNRKLDLNYMSI